MFIYNNPLGQQGAGFKRGKKEAGYYRIPWNEPDLSPGAYFYRLTAGSFKATKKLLLVK